MSLHTINRMSTDKFGTGLPVYTKKEYQIRKPNLLGDSLAHEGSRGYWICPSNKLPTLQFLYTGATLTTLELIKTCGANDIETITLNTSEVETLAITTGTVFYITDDERKFSLCRGLYYLRFELSDGQEYFSEVFSVWAICALNNKITYSIQQVLPDLSANVKFTVFSSSSNDIQTITTTINAVDYLGNGEFIVNVPNGGSTIIHNVLSEQCGTYEQGYTFVNNAGVTFSLDKVY